MGCSQSKSAVTSQATPAPSAPNHTQAQHTAHNSAKSSSSGSQKAASTSKSRPKNGGKTPLVSKIPPSPRSQAQHEADSRWNTLYEMYKPVDPQDVKSVLEMSISRQIRRLSPTEVTFLQRTVRQIGNALPASGKLTMGQRLRSGAGSMLAAKASQDNGSLDARTIRDRHHLLDETVIRKLWLFRNTDMRHPEWLVRVQGDSHGGTSTNGSATVDPVGAAYVLMLHLSESLWDRVETIADDSAKKVGLDLDVNHPQTKQKVPLPQFFPPEGPLDTPPGVTFANVCFLTSLGLRGSRPQRLQLLFYLLLPPKVLSNFICRHPAGGVATWLVEVGSGVILSLASLAHYYFFGASFLPDGSNVTIPGKAVNESLVVRCMGALETLVNLLYMTHLPLQERSAHPSPERRASGGGSSRPIPSSSSSSSLVADWSSAVGPSQSVVMERMQQVREGRRLAYEDSALSWSIDRFWEASEPHLDKSEEKWTFDVFARWANEALDDTALDAIMYRLFAAGNLASPSLEKELVLSRWKEWQESDRKVWNVDDEPDALGSVGQSARGFFPQMTNGHTSFSGIVSPVWGGIGGFDGRGGLGHGVMYCIDKKWWDQWVGYVGWNWTGDNNLERLSRERPGELSTDRLLDRSPEAIIPGSYGSYEAMKVELVKNVDFVVVPAGVWSVLFELYGGGPPLPRMVLPPQIIEQRERTFSTDSKQMEEDDIIFSDRSVEVVSPKPSKILQMPDALGVVTHPWIIHCQICDSQQPYRRGDAGQMSIRVMATPDQPLWRLYAEIIMRLPVANVKARNKNGRGATRLWRRVDGSVAKDGMARYGPWSLLCKNRIAILPSTDHSRELHDSYEDLKGNWQTYADHSTVEGIGLANGDRLMLEYAVVTKKDTIIWPREAAAKAGKERLLAEEDAKFRRFLKGVDEKGMSLEPPPSLVGLNVDAMDVSGRWFSVEITHVQVVEDDQAEETEGEDDDDELEEADATAAPENKKRQVRVEFDESAGHAEWILVESDRLAVAGRFTSSTADDGNEDAEGNGKKSPTTSKTKVNSITKKSSSDLDQGAGKICTLPGYGACGLNNLGNTCYANSALQCVSYMPILRSYLLSAQYKATGDLNKDNPLGTGGKLLEEFSELLRVMWSGKYGERSPTRFRGQLGKARSQFSGADQQDAQELLNYLLDVLHEDSNKVKTKPYVEALDDDWVKSNSLSRFGEEAWRRFLRRNRSIMADVAMGQVLNTVTCPKCQFSSWNFDPFNLLSIPLPTVADVIYQCTIARRATEANSHQIFYLNERSKKERRRGRKIADDPQPPSPALVFEQYAIALSRLADIGDLKLQLQNLSGISAGQLKLCKLDEVDLKHESPESSPVRKHMRVMALSDKDGPACLQGNKGPVGKVTTSTTRIIAFQNTLKPRVLKSVESLQEEEEEGGDGHMESTDSDATSPSDEDDVPACVSTKGRLLVNQALKYYGDRSECGEYDTDTLHIAKAISRGLWPNNENEFKIGLRVDAIDQKDHWFPGSVVEIFPRERENDPSEEENVQLSKAKVKIHFDCFSSKWDEIYTIDHFTRGQVRPLYSHATPRPKPTEFIVHHRHQNRQTKANVLFGQAFFLQCHTEWSTARAGAHILAQSARFLQNYSEIVQDGPIDVDHVFAVEKVKRIQDKAQGAVSELIKLLIECDRTYVRAALGVSQSDNPQYNGMRNPNFDATAMANTLVEKVGALLHRLPFEVRVCTLDTPTGHKVASSNEEFPYPFSLLRTIGNYMHGRHGIILHWREFPTDKSGSNTIPVMYVPPHVAIHKGTAAFLEETEKKAATNKTSMGSGGLQLSECLMEFCKEQKLSLSDNWRCPQCKEYREGKQNMSLWRLPDLLTFHVKRFNCSARWREKISTKVNFPLTGLDLTEWCNDESPAALDPDDSCVYDLIGVLNHYGSMTGGHYIACCRATICSPEGSEEVAYGFPSAGTNALLEHQDETADTSATGDDRTGWRLGPRKDKENSSQQQRIAAAAAAKGVSQSAEPLWLQFDDELVEPIPPRNVVSEMAYVLFYRRRRMTSSNIAKYSSLA